MLDDIENIGLLLDGQFPSLWDRMPFLQATAATRGRRVLSDEDGMVSHRGLLAVVDGMGRGEPLRDEACAMLEDCIKPLLT